MNKKIILIVAIISFVLICVGVGFGFMLDSDKPKDKEYTNTYESPEEEMDEQELEIENVNIYSTVDDAIEYLKSVYDTEDVEISYNDGMKMIIKIFINTPEEISYTYYINGGDLLSN